MYRKASVSESTLKTRKRQWHCYVNICKMFKWAIYRYSSVINYYQTVICYHNIRGIKVTDWSDPVFAQTIKGIKKSERCQRM